MTESKRHLPEVVSPKEWEEPEGRSDGPMMSWLRRHDEYEKKPVQVESS